MRWAIPFLFSFTTIAILGLAIFLVVQFGSWLPVIVTVLVIGALGFWVFGCIFTPAIPDRTCPKCKHEALVRPRKDPMLGVRCENCGFEDAEMYRAYLDEV